MSELGKITASPSSRLLEIGGKQVQVHPMTFADIAVYEDWAVEKYLADVERALRHSKASDEHKEARRRKAEELAERLSMNLKVTDDAEAHAVMSKLAKSVEGFTMLIWLATRYAGVTKEQVADAMKDSQLKAMATKDFNKVNGNDAKKDEGGGTEPAAEGSPSTS